MTLRTIHFIALAVLLTLGGCVDMLSGEVEEQVRDNPNDLDGTNFLAPEISIVENGANEFGEVTVQWQGGPSAISNQLEYRFTVLGETSDWSADNTSYSALLANGSYNIEVEARYASLPNENRARTSASAAINVTSAPNGPYIVSYPHRKTRGSNEEFVFYNYVLDGQDLFGVNMIFDYNSNVFEVLEIRFTEGDENLFDRNNINTHTEDFNDISNQQFEFAQVALTNPAQGVNGFGKISMVRMRVRTGVVTGTYSISVNTESDLRNTNNESILQGSRGLQITVN